MAKEVMTRSKMPIQTRLSLLDKKQVDLLPELRRNGYPKIDQSTLNRYIKGRVITPQAQSVLELCREILAKWESAV